MMEVILLERIENLGQMGDVVNVKPGYARNFLLPKKKALRATEDNRRQFEDRRTQLEAQNLERRSEADKIGQKMNGLLVTLIRQAGEAGQLYGSVNARDIAAEVTAAGFTVTRLQVRLEHPIKSLGLFPVKVALHPEVIISVTTNVARSEGEAKEQAKTGVAVVRTDEEDAAPSAKDKDAAPGEDAAPDLSELVDEGVDLPDEVTGETTEEKPETPPVDSTDDKGGDKGNDKGDDETK